MCGSTQRQNDINNQQTAFMGQLMDQYKTTYGTNQAILGQLTKSLAPIVNAGPGQEGFGANEKAALNTQATQGAGQAYAQTQKAVNESMMSRGGGNNPLTSGAEAQINAGIGVSAENNLGNEKLGLVKADYDQGRQNYFAAQGALAGAPGELESPLAGQAGAVNGASGEAASEANAIQKANSSWMGLVGGLANTALGVATGGISTAAQAATGGGGIFDSSGDYMGE